MTEHEPPAIAVQDDGRTTRSRRIMGKLFGRDRERKATRDDGGGDLNSFFHGSTDKLQVAHAGPPLLTKIDTATGTRFPNAHDVDAGSEPRTQEYVVRPRDPPRDPARRPRKGLAVRFVDTYPEIMGEGGDQCEAPTLEISKRKKQRPQPSPAVAPSRPANFEDDPRNPFSDAQAAEPSFNPGLRRTQTGFSTRSGAPESGPLSPGMNTARRQLGTPTTSNDERRRSFIEVQQAQMREAEGQAFANALRSTSGDDQSRPYEQADPSPPSSDYDTQSPITASPDSMQPPQVPLSPRIANLPPIPPKAQRQRPPLPQIPPPPPPESRDTPRNAYTPTSQHSNSPERLKRTQTIENSPTTLYSATPSFHHPFASSRQGSNYASPAQPQGATSFQDVVAAASDDALNAFVARTRHLFELFRLHAESVRSLVSSTPHDLARAALWWFLTGRTALELAIRDRPSTPESQMKNEMAKQQAYADLAKCYWLLEEAMPEVLGSGRSPIDQDAESVRTTLVSSLRKLAVSMKRNGFLPPDEAFLPQTINRAIWLEYPPLSQDIKSLLWGSNSALAQSHATSGMTILESMPLGDSGTTFCFARFQVDVFLMEQGRESQRLFIPCFLSITRPQTQPEILFILASQNGATQLRISGNKNTGPVWEDVRWRQENCNLEVRLPRGFILLVQCTQQSYATLRSMYEFSAKVHSSLYPRQDENCIFRSTLRAFQYFDNDPQSRQFPKESTPNCEIALFERLFREGAATGPRIYHRGYRIAVVTGPRTKTLSGVNQTYLPQTPIQFGFLRSEANDPALSLKFDDGRFKGNMVLSFADETERLRMHSLLIGTALGRGESVFGEAQTQGVWFSERYGDARDKGLQALSALAWNKVRVINDDNDGDKPSCVLADRLRIVYEFKDGTFTDRLNVAPGELKLRLDVQNPSCMMVFRQPQPDVTLAVTEANAARGGPGSSSGGLGQALESLKQTATIRTFMFPNVAELHAFETAITGFKVLFDGTASAFAISRRRMVVPIHKKWEAGATRIQVVQQDGVAQLLAFFEDFSHGKCMGFHLKGTDVYESFGRGGKVGLKIDDAKFPLPRVLAPEAAESAQLAADAAFLCLDLPELPGEHDDISILFDNEAVRDKFITCLPAPVKGTRLPKIKGITS
ncbi:hypothetical protein C8A00DRAFT_30186 [Chaetomidium leptoderma]|uniref:Uncharacterized protein n=1 Tax=Chaetomidium leptoderma TaxID=669021 RepID=A0AAN6VT01_9PEZI|nr:hypothetical protein C8A00DRAFT_30186 [Chaetomidium leptoderma]